MKINVKEAGRCEKYASKRIELMNTREYECHMTIRVLHFRIALGMTHTGYKIGLTTKVIT